MIVLTALTLRPLSSRAVQNPSISLDMVTTGNSYTPGADVNEDGFPDPGTNHMIVGTIDPCLTSAAPGSNATHNHLVHLVIHNIEDLVGWQARTNFIGDRMRIFTFDPVPFADSSVLNERVGFTNLPLDGGSHHMVVPSSSIPAAPPDGTNTHQTARFGAQYAGALTFAVSPDTPPKAVHDETNQTYGTTSGGILAAVTLQVVGNEQGQPSLFIDLDDSNPNSPGSEVYVFTGTGSTTIAIPANQLGDGLHGEGVACVADSDQDGWSGGAEEIIGTDPFDACADNAADDAWPADINNSGFSDTADIVFLTNDFGYAVPAAAPARHDIAPDPPLAPPNAFVDTADIARMTGLFGQSCE